MYRTLSGTAATNAVNCSGGTGGNGGNGTGTAYGGDGGQGGYSGGLTTVDLTAGTYTNSFYSTSAGIAGGVGQVNAGGTGGVPVGQSFNL
jgi:hypothetical protein